MGKLHKEYLWYVQERERIRVRRAEGKKKPWTNDLTLQSYSFCNNDREHDRVTIWLRENWREPHADDPDLWFAMCVARMAINWPPTMAELGYPVPWHVNKFVATLQALAPLGKIYGGAYMIGTQGNAGNKAEFLADKLLSPLWAARAQLRPRTGDTLAAFHARLVKFYAVGSFTAAQVIADTKHHTPALKATPDWFDWAASGPGSRRGLNRVLGREVDARWREDEWLLELNNLQTWANERHGLNYDAQNTQNTLCEFFKYVRGYGKARFAGV